MNRKQARVVIKASKENSLEIEIIGLCCDTLMIDEICQMLGGCSAQHTARSIIIPLHYTIPPPKIEEESDDSLDMSVPSDDEVGTTIMPMIQNLAYMSRKSLLK